MRSAIIPSNRPWFVEIAAYCMGGYRMDSMREILSGVTQFFRPMMTSRFGGTLFVAIVLFMLAFFPFAIKYKELFAETLPNPTPAAVRFVLSMQEWLLVGVTLSASASLNWFESRMDSGLRAPSAILTGLSLLGCLLCIMMFAYYRGQLVKIAANLQFFTDEMSWVFGTVAVTVVCYFLSVLQTRREKDLVEADMSPLNGGKP